MSKNLKSKIVITVISVLLLITIASVFEIFRDLQKLKLEFYSMNTDVYSTLKTLNQKLDIQQERIDVIISEFKDLKVKTDKIENKVENLTKEVNLISERAIKIPTLQIVKEFLEEDDTDKQKYEEDKFTCVNYANMFVDRFLKKGYYSCVAYLLSTNSAHTIVAIKTLDYGKIYVEPQSDQIIYNINIGDNYCSLINQSCYYPIIRIVDCFNY
jgi:predicted nuclease with TOPRIM domain